MLSEYITSLADVSFHIAAYVYARFRYSRKIQCGLRFFGVFMCGFAVFGPPLTPPSWIYKKKIADGYDFTYHTLFGFITNQKCIRRNTKNKLS